MSYLRAAEREEEHLGPLFHGGDGLLAQSETGVDHSGFSEESWSTEYHCVSPSFDYEVAAGEERGEPPQRCSRS